MRTEFITLTALARGHHTAATPRAPKGYDGRVLCLRIASIETMEVIGLRTIITQRNGVVYAVKEGLADIGRTIAEASR